MMDVLFSNFDSLSESSSSDDQDDIEYIYGRHASCILSSLEETMGKIDNFLSFERGYTHGDTVYLITDPSGQMGNVINVEMLVDLENTRGCKINDVNSARLQKIKSFSEGDHVVQGPWLGRVDKVIDCVSILFDDGTKSDITTMGPEKLVPISPDIVEDSQYPFYPGQRVRVELSSVVKSSRWLCGRPNKKQEEGTVCSVDAGLVYVDWLSCAFVGCERGPAPPCLIDSKTLNLLSCFSHANWQLGDWCKLSVVENKSAKEHIFFDAPPFRFIEGNKQPKNVTLGKSYIPDFQEIFVIVKTMTKVDVLWQDGSLSLGLDSKSLFPVDIVEAHDFLPDQFVLEKGTCDDPSMHSTQRWGVVQTMDAKERTVKVKWKSFPASETSDLEKDQVEEIVSAYELVEHPDYSFCLGDAVFRLEKDPFIDMENKKTFNSSTFSEFGMDKEAKKMHNFCVQNHKECPNSSHLSYIGIVIGFQDGDVEVKWATGLTTKVAPYMIFRVGKSEDISSVSVQQESSANTPYEEVTDHEYQSLGNKEQDLLSLSGGDKECEIKSWESSSFSFCQAAVAFLTSMTSNLFGSLSSASMFTMPEYMSECSKMSEISNEEEVELCNLCSRVPLQFEGESQTISNHKIEVRPGNDIQFSSGCSWENHFRHFDVVNDCLDHHFVNGSGKAQISSQVKRSWLKNVHKEWSILEKDLSETIYVRVYEERMDLLRAAIVGAPGTPYHDGLFFFDIFLPPEYPQVPPIVHYYSGGLRLNPNLYESGKVCLSLLNTWTGTGSEVWSPDGSTILQVLLSLQALVLNDKPYFNEAGYDKQMGRAEGEKNSVTYNENAFLVSCKSMLYTLRKPPKHFEALVQQHFGRSCNDILSACKAYMEGLPVGFCVSEHKTTKQKIYKGSSSTGFKIMLAKLFPKLVETFSGLGMDCSQFLKPES